MPGAGKLRSIRVYSYSKTRLSSDDSIECAWVILQGASSDTSPTYWGDWNCSAFTQKGLALQVNGQHQPTIIPGPVKLYDIFVHSNDFTYITVNYQENPR